MVDANELAIERTKLANQRTYLSYMTTGWGIATLAGNFKKNYLLYFGIFMILMSSVQYYLAISNLNNKKKNDYKILDYLPLIYIPLSMVVLYLQFFKHNKKN